MVQAIVDEIERKLYTVAIGSVALAVTIVGEKSLRGFPLSDA